MEPRHVLVVDDHNLFRQGLIGLIRTRSDIMRVIGEAASGLEAIELTERLHPDLIMMDLFMPEMDGLEAMQKILARHPDIAVVMLTSSEDDEHLAEAMRLGASGYLAKTLEAEELFKLVEAVVEGEIALTASMANRLLARSRKLVTAPTAYGMALTDREREVLELIALGASNNDIADALCISRNTVKIHVRNVLQKLQVENRTQAATQAIQRGLVHRDLPGLG